MQRHLSESASARHAAKKIRVGRSPSVVSAGRPPPRTEQGVTKKLAVKVKRVANKAQMPRNRLARKGEGDHHIGTKMPKHLFAGKRKAGKTDRR